MHNQYDTDLEKLRSDTRKLWHPGMIEQYIRDLLPREIAYAENSGAQDTLPPCDTLVLMLGLSPEPLLQTIYLYKPKRIILVCNYQYKTGDDDSMRLSGREQATEFREQVHQLCRQEPRLHHTRLPQFDSGTDRADIAIALEEAKPHWVFRELCERILRAPNAGSRKVVVDITGAKKSMVTGAYLFADYSGATISYVDFDEYDPESRRPYGYTCRIGALPNPSEVMSIRDWARVRNLYNSFFFGTAEDETKAIYTRMTAGIATDGATIPYFTQNECDAVARVLCCFRLLQLWDNGDHAAAWQEWVGPTDSVPLRDELIEPEQFILPEAVEVLGNSGWPTGAAADAQSLLNSHIELKFGQRRESIFRQNEMLAAYAQDERDKIGRLIDENEDYRSAFLRAAALDEFLLKARLALLWNQGLITSSDDPETCFRAVTSATDTRKLRPFLQQQEETIDIRFFDARTKKTVTCRFRHVAQEQRQKPLDNYWGQVTGLAPDKMTDLRGESIHTYLPIPQEIARHAHCMAALSVEDYFKHWLDDTAALHGGWEPDWDALCRACGLTFLPSIPKEATA